MGKIFYYTNVSELRLDIDELVHEIHRIIKKIDPDKFETKYGELFGHIALDHLQDALSGLEVF